LIHFLHGRCPPNIHFHSYTLGYFRFGLKERRFLPVRMLVFGSLNDEG
jgi:hypothetical protein